MVEIVSVIVFIIVLYCSNVWQVPIRLLWSTFRRKPIYS